MIQAPMHEFNILRPSTQLPPPGPHTGPPYRPARGPQCYKFPYWRVCLLAPDVRSMVESSYSAEPAYKEVRAGTPEEYGDITTLGGLLDANYKLPSSREQVRRNLLSMGRGAYPGIIGFDDDVIPALDRALLSGHDTFLIGQMGQAKTRLVRSIAENLLSPIPVIRNSATNDCPMDLPAADLADALEGTGGSSRPVFHVSPESLEVLRERGLETPVEWLGGARRFRYVLATPDTTVRDLVGSIDAVKVAKKGTEMYRIDSYSPGQLMQAKHGIFCIDELPVLDPRKQVALLSVLQEGRFTTGPYPVYFEPRTMLFATANPVDYTHSGRVIEPLLDRLASHVHTHYPPTIHDEMMIIMQEARLPPAAVAELPLRALAGVIAGMRNSGQINQERGVSARTGIHGLEILVSEAERTRPTAAGALPAPRLSDFHALEQVAKFELTELDDTVENRARVFAEIMDAAVGDACLGLLEGTVDEELQLIKDEFGAGTFRSSQEMQWSGGADPYERQMADHPLLSKLLESRLEMALEAQAKLVADLGEHGIQAKAADIGQDHDGLRAVLLEGLLEGLCHTKPRMLERRDAGYSPA
ncbi:Mg-chelatase subunit [Cenarchaeum symbiosum A]|uniref:Mg-chelatase subunit n=1 Tax=Cenarchaeum symbiosum (strain A) TaxID=414004 RepID=A0RXY9_CENSY|nr:Mg-chelatase subunit [Cenarchaeum symbiosum A]